MFLSGKGEDRMDTKMESLRSADTLTVCRTFYEKYGSRMIHEKFPDYESRIAVGLVGEGSECFGFDDEISRDHDFGLGFCMWLNKEDYHAIGDKLQAAYRNLVKEEGAVFSENIWGEPLTLSNQRIDGRRGVMEIDSFYGNILRLQPDLNLIIGEQYWVYAEPKLLATAVNGQVFRDDAGEFSSVRRTIKNYYPQNIYLFRLADQLHLFSHGGQSNYPRMMARKDIVAARLCIDQTIRAAMDITYLLAREYPPYYKWTFRGLEKLPVLKELPSLLRDLASMPPQTDLWDSLTYSALRVFTEDPVIRKVEEIACLLVEEMNRQKIIFGNEKFLESYVPVLAERAESESP